MLEVPDFDASFTAAESLSSSDRYGDAHVEELSIEIV